MNDSLILIALLTLNATYLYFWISVMWATYNKHVNRKPIDDSNVSRALAYALTNRHTALFIIQITTKGGQVEVVKRGITNILKAVRNYPTLSRLVSVEVITEDAEEALELGRLYYEVEVPVTVYVLPESYFTPKETAYKARALHYMVQMHRKDPTDAYVVHFDEESVFAPANLARLVERLLVKPVGISEGMITYGLEWYDANVLCRTMESNRPFGCHECYTVMTLPPPLHLHGSNLVIKQSIENELGWDIGTYKGQALIAEDLVFGLMAYLRYGKSVFGWHGAEMIEQPPFTVKAAFKQRERWIMGALQGVAHIKEMSEWKQLPLIDRLKIGGLIRLRIYTYALGFPVSLLAILANAIVVGVAISAGQVNSEVNPLMITALLMWLGGTQLGLFYNLRTVKQSKWGKLREHLTVLVLSPIAGAVDTFGPIVAITKWAFGKRGIAWNPTPKYSPNYLKDIAPVKLTKTKPVKAPVSVGAE